MPWGDFFTIIVQLLLGTIVGAVCVLIVAAVVMQIRKQ